MEDHGNLKDSRENHGNMDRERRQFFFIGTGSADAVEIPVVKINRCLFILNLIPAAIIYGNYKQLASVWICIVGKTSGNQ